MSARGRPESRGRQQSSRLQDHAVANQSVDGLGAGDARTVANSLLHLADGLAGIYGVATVPEERAEGLGAHVTADALRHARRLGYGVGTPQSSPAVHNVCLGLGFEYPVNVPMFVRMPV